MCENFIVMALMKLAVMSGFAYVIWILAAKEGPSLKAIGQAIAIAIIAFAILSAAIPGRIHGPGMGREMRMQKSPSGMELREDKAMDEKGTERQTSPQRDDLKKY
jgi:hypothetical protein